MKNKRNPFLALLLAAAVLTGALTGCSETQETADESQDIQVSDSISGEKLTAGAAADNVFSLAVDYSRGLNPITTESSLNMIVNGLVYDLLFEVDDNYNVTSRVLEDWYYVEESNVWVLAVRPDIAMHDGSLLTAEDVVYSISRALQYSEYYRNRLGTVYSGGSGTTVYVQSEYPNTLLPYRLTVPLIKSGSILEDMPVGSGPYMYSASGETLEKFTEYDGAENLPVDTIYLRQYTDAENLISEYESSYVDLTVNDPTSIYNMGYGGMNEKHVITTTHMHYIGFNGYSTFLCYSQYRSALNWIIDRNTIADSVLGGAATASALPIHPNSSLFSTEINDSLAYSPSRCLTEMEKMGCRDLDADGQLEFAISGSKVEIEIDFIVCSDSTSKVVAARQIAEDMEAIGLTVNLRELSWNDFRNTLANPRDDDGKPTFDMYYAETALTPDWDIIPFIEEDGALNFGGWDMADLENAVYSYLAADDETRSEATAVMLQQLSSSGVILPVCFEKREVISHLGIITGMTPNQYNIFHDFGAWEIHLE